MVKIEGSGLNNNNIRFKPLKEHNQQPTTKQLSLSNTASSSTVGGAINEFKNISFSNKKKKRPNF